MDKLKQDFIAFAKRRAEESKGTPYEWDFNQLYDTDDDFMDIIESCEVKRLHWHNTAYWDELMDWFENLPIY
jgi:hypothetical protein